MKNQIKKFEKLKLKKSEAASIKGGTSATEFTRIGYGEMEQELDSDGNKIGKPILTDFPVPKLYK